VAATILPCRYLRRALTHPATANLQAFLGAVGSLPGGELHERDGVLWCRSPIPWPMFNGAIASADGDGAAEAVGSLVEGGRPWFAWQLPDSPPALVEAAARAGAREFDGREPWVQARVADLAEPEVPASVTIEEVDDEAGYRLWAAMMREIYGFPELGERAWTMPGELLGWSGLPWRQWIAYADGEPAGITLLYCGGGIATLLGVGTKPEARRRGIGRLVTLLPLKRSGQEVAGFFATEEGMQLYRALGFRENGWVSRWLGGL
jgi:ribosomal protein S18 acetylase RimI-like enzyme